MTSAALSPNHDPEIVAQAVYRELAHLHPQRLAIPELTLRIAADPDDETEVDAIAEAVRELRHCSLVRYRNDDGVLELTYPALCAFALLQD